MPTSAPYSSLVRRYARYAPDYDRRWARYNEATLAIAERLITRHAPRAAALLDVGCGTGLLAQRLRRRRPELHLIGVDVCEDMLDRARHKFAGDCRAEFISATAEALPFADESCDVVACTSAFHLVRDQETALAEFHRVLVPGGILVLLDWDRRAAAVRLVSALYRAVGRHRRRILRHDEAYGMIDQADFEIIEAHSHKATAIWGISAIVARSPALFTVNVPPASRARVLSSTRAGH
jgi:ubiquinone/menaquinone biosynthesis C-methylase UbiE